MSRVFYFDALRFIAIFAVVLQHTGRPWFPADGSEGIEWWIDSMLYAPCFFAVPIFFMISGALLLEQYPTKPGRQFFLRRFDKVVVPMVIWAIIYMYVWFPHIAHGEATANPWSAFKMILMGEVYYHYHFLYSLLYLYALVPILSYFVNHATPTEVKRFAIAWFAFAVVTRMVELHAGWQLEYASVINHGPLKYISYLLLGWYIHKHVVVSRQLFGVSSMLVVICPMLLIVANYYLSIYSGFHGERIKVSYADPLIIIYSLAVFTCVKYLLQHVKVKEKPGIADRMVRLGAQTSFGVYFIHQIFIEEWERLLPEDIHFVTEIVSVAFLSYVASFVVVYLLQKTFLMKYLAPKI